MTYSEVLYYIKSLADNLPTKVTVTKGEVSTIDLSKGTVFPLVHLDIATGVINQGATMTYNVYIAVLQERDLNPVPNEDKFWGNDNEVDNHNETMLILQTIWTQIYRDWQDLYISANDNPTVEKITYAKGNILDGWAVSFSVEVPFSIELCE